MTQGAPDAVGPGFRLADVDPASTPGLHGGHHRADHDRHARADELAGLQERLYADGQRADADHGGRRSVLLVLQGMDTAGKGGIVRHVIGLVDPQGVELHAFKAPTRQELAHDFLWRIEQRLPTPGMIGVFDRSHYEDVLIARVRSLAPDDEIEARYGRIIEFEHGLVAAGTAVVKVMLHISKEEQGRRLRRRLERPDKHWKYNPTDVDERRLWDGYQDAYDVAVRRTSTPEAPWFVVPADHKWYARWAVEQVLLQALRGIDPRWPQADYDVQHELGRLARS